MSLTVVSLGGPVAPEGEDMLRAAGIASLATAPYPSREEVIELLSFRQPDALIVRLVERIDETVLRASPRLRLVHKHGAGTNDIDVAAATALGIPVAAAVGANAHSVAEHAFALMFALIKDLRAQDAFVRGGGWAKKTYQGHELRGRILGLVGMALSAATSPAWPAPSACRWKLTIPMRRMPPSAPIAHAPPTSTICWPARTSSACIAP